MKKFKVTLHLTNGMDQTFYTEAATSDHLFISIYQGGEFYDFEVGRSKSRVRSMHISQVSIVELLNNPGPEPS